MSKIPLLIGVALVCLISGENLGQEGSAKSVLLEVVRTSWDVDRDETLVYLRVYSDGFAEAHPIRKVDFRNITFAKKQLSRDEFEALHTLLTDPGTSGLQPKYSRDWGNKDFGSKYHITIFRSSENQVVELTNFQPFLARKQGKPYPSQVEKIGCFVWKLRAEVSDEPLEKDWLGGCKKLGY